MNMREETAFEINTRAWEITISDMRRRDAANASNSNASSPKSE
jgi:hypothetical protein